MWSESIFLWFAVPPLHLFNFVLRLTPSWLLNACQQQLVLHDASFSRRGKLLPINCWEKENSDLHQLATPEPILKTRGLPHIDTFRPGLIEQLQCKGRGNFPDWSCLGIAYPWNRDEVKSSQTLLLVSINRTGGIDTEEITMSSVHHASITICNA